MTKWFRWPGLAGFVLLLGLFAFFWLLLLDGLVKDIIEKQGSNLVGAKVELAGCDVTFLPMGLTLAGLKVTDPDEPMRNSLEIGRLAMSVAPGPLLRRKVIIEEMSATGIRFGTPRQRSGALPARKQQKPEDKAGGFNLPSFTMPDVRSVLAKETLTTITLAQEFEDRLARDKAAWQKRLDELPDREKLADYQARLKKLKAGGGGVTGLLAGASELNKLQREIKADIERLKSAEADFKARSAEIKQELADLKAAPQRDVRRLTSKYGPSGGGLANISGLVFGERVGSLTRTALSWYGRLQPLLANRRQEKDGVEVAKPVRGKGVQVHFTEYQPLPGFLIRRIEASVELEAGTCRGTINNLTPDQDILGKPLTMQFAGSGLAGLRALELTASFDHVQPQSPHDQLSLTMNGYQVQELELAGGGTLPVSLEKASADLSVRAAVKGQSLDATLTADLQAARFVSRAATGNTLQQALAATLSEVRQASVTATLRGTLENQGLSLHSNLDQVLRQAVSKTLEQQTSRFALELKQAVAAKVEMPLSGAATASGGLDQVGDELAQRLQMGEKLLR